MSKKQNLDRDLAAARRACVTGSKQDWNSEELLSLLNKAIAAGWTGPALKAWAWEFRYPRSERVTPYAYRMSLALMDMKVCWRLPAKLFLKDFKANPDAYSHVH